jgi:RNA polymerase sigma-70 factor (ECF subfamily)
MSVPAKHQQTVDEAISSLVSRAADPRGLTADELRPRVESALRKYIFNDNPDAGRTDIKQFVDDIRADDICLIIACERGDEKAWEHLVANFDATVKSAARKVSANNEDAEDLASSIWAELYGLRQDAEGNKKSKLAYYSGRGSLAGWLRAVVAQLAVDVFRKQSRLVQTEEDTDLERLARVAEGQPIVAGVPNPEESISNRFAQTDMQQALHQSVQELPAEDRLLVKLYYFDNLRLREAGAVLGVHEATASRRLTRIQTDLRKRVTKILVDERGWTQAETERSFAEVAQHLDTDLESILSKEAADLSR